MIWNEQLLWYEINNYYDMKLTIIMIWNKQLLWYAINNYYDMK